MSWRPTDEWPDGHIVLNPRDVEASLVVAAKETGPLMPGPGRRMRKLGRTCRRRRPGRPAPRHGAGACRAPSPASRSSDPTLPRRRPMPRASRPMPRRKKGSTDDADRADAPTPKPQQGRRPDDRRATAARRTRARRQVEQVRQEQQGPGQEGRGRCRDDRLVAASGEPTITSDKADYPPGGKVVLTGTNWQGDEPSGVQIVVNDDAGKSWSRGVIVDVAKDGTIKDSSSSRLVRGEVQRRGHRPRHRPRRQDVVYGRPARRRHRSMS